MSHSIYSVTPIFLLVAATTTAVCVASFTRIDFHTTGGGIFFIIIISIAIDKCNSRDTLTNVTQMLCKWQIIAHSMTAKWTVLGIVGTMFVVLMARYRRAE